MFVVLLITNSTR